MAAGRLITIEGIDGAGKTTLTVALRDALQGRGANVHLLREPGGVRAAERIRELVKDPEARIGARANRETDGKGHWSAVAFEIGRRFEHQARRSGSKAE